MLFYRCKTRLGSLAFALFALVALLCTAASAANLAEDFSISSNPNGPWAYGVLSGATFTPHPTYETAQTSNGSTLAAWHPTGDWAGCISKNLGPYPIADWGSYREIGMVSLDVLPSSSNMVCVRYQPPASGTYNLSIRFNCQTSIGANTHAYVYIIKVSSGGTTTYLNPNGSAGEHIAGFIGTAASLFSDRNLLTGIDPMFMYLNASVTLSAGDSLYLAGLHDEVGGGVVGVAAEINQASATPDMLTWMDCTLPQGTCVKVHAEQRTALGQPWTPFIADYQPFRTQTDRLYKTVYWRKDDTLHDFYGELYTYDYGDGLVRLHTETYPVDSGGGWNPVIDRVRLYYKYGGADWSYGRPFANTGATVGWSVTNHIQSYICQNWNQLNTSMGTLEWDLLYNSSTISRMAPFNVLFDGECAGYPATSDFMTFDEAIVVTMYDSSVWDRYFYARKGSTYYGCVRWDTAQKRNGNWVVLQRTVGLDTYQPAGFSFKGFDDRVIRDRWITPWQ